ncbi:MAG: 2'-5' RNA ligase family protein [Parcubacteria group bacterium]|nr:2'-5' RNA ligase family protein [Parcubacteria group bacterium]
MEKNVARYDAALTSIAKKSRPFSVSFSKIVCGPSPRDHRFIWAEGRAPQKLLLLKRALARAVAVPAASFAFRMHITLAFLKPEDAAIFPANALPQSIAWEDTVNAFVLMESVRLPKRTDYRILRTYTF